MESKVSNWLNVRPAVPVPWASARALMQTTNLVREQWRHETQHSFFRITFACRRELGRHLPLPLASPYTLSINIFTLSPYFYCIFDVRFVAYGHPLPVQNHLLREQNWPREFSGPESPRFRADFVLFCLCSSTTPCRSASLWNLKPNNILLDRILNWTNLLKLPVSFPTLQWTIFRSRKCYTIFLLLAVLVLYLTKDLMFNKANGKSIYHAFSMTSYFTGVIGAMIADSWLGKYRYVQKISTLSLQEATSFSVCYAVHCDSNSEVCGRNPENESYRGVLSCVTVYYTLQGVSNYTSVDQTLNVSPLKWKQLSSTFMWYCYVMLYKIILTFKYYCFLEPSPTHCFFIPFLRSSLR